jgi:AcrR family transcriptional regulator
VKNSEITPIQDHRPRVAAERREKMRLRLLATALCIGAKKGPAFLSIDDIVVGADVSRGSFYKYFDSIDALMRNVATQIANELIGMAEPIVQEMDDPAQRVASGIRLVSRIALLQPVVASFLVKLGLPNVHRPDVLLAFVKRDLKNGIDRGCFTEMPLTLALNIVSGSVLGAAQCLLEPDVERNFAELSAETALRALGVPPDRARHLSTLPLKDLDLSTSSLFAGSLLDYVDRSQDADQLPVR